jgi:death on curing protein
MIVQYLSPDEIIEIHALLIGQFGGTLGIRDRGLLESACYRPRSGYYDTVFEQSAALLQSLTNNHVFVDGNKRIAWTAARVFLHINGVVIKAAADVAEQFIIEDVIKSKMEVPYIAAWLSTHAHKK